jgi:hypothetical protein
MITLRTAPGSIRLGDWVLHDRLSGIVVGISSNCVGRVFRVRTDTGPDAFIAECRLIRLEPPRSKPVLVWSRP